MSRKQSVILTPTQHKVAITDAKQAYRETGQKLAKLLAERKKLDDEIKNLDKQIIEARKAATKAEQDLEATRPFTVTGEVNVNEAA